MRKFQQKKIRGFTLIELLLVMAIMALIGGISVPVYQSFQVKNSADVASFTIVQTLRRAQILSQSVSGDSTWGVSVLSGGVTLFKGASFASRDATYDEFFEMPTSISVSGLSEVVYAKLTGEPQSPGSITLTTSNNDTKTITVNAKGMVEY